MKPMIVLSIKIRKAFGINYQNSIYLDDISTLTVLN